MEFVNPPLGKPSIKVPSLKIYFFDWMNFDSRSNRHGILIIILKIFDGILAIVIELQSINWERDLNNTRYKVIRSSSAIKTWLPLSLAAGVITFLMLSILTSIPLERAIVGSALTAVLVFSGMFFRSFGKEKERYDQ